MVKIVGDRDIQWERNEKSLLRETAELVLRPYQHFAEAALQERKRGYLALSAGKGSSSVAIETTF